MPDAAKNVKAPVAGTIESSLALNVNSSCQLFGWHRPHGAKSRLTKRDSPISSTHGLLSPHPLLSADN